MSSTLKIEPLERKKLSLSYELKLMLQKRNSNKCIFNVKIDETDLPYFEGLRDAGIKDAEVVISFIGKHGECIITEEF